MQNFLEPYLKLAETPLGCLDLVAGVIISLCVLAIFASVLINFIEGARHITVKQRQRSIVATGTMTVFFLFLFALIRFGIGMIPVEDTLIRATSATIGLLIIVFGGWVNIAGRVKLGRNWANQVTIYRDQQLVEAGVYRWVRHPLYASLIWMFYGASLVYLNVAVFMATTLVFLPFMYYRARQEEKLLQKEFAHYTRYRQRVGMFFPKLWS